MADFEDLCACLACSALCGLCCAAAADDDRRRDNRCHREVVYVEPVPVQAHYVQQPNVVYAQNPNVMYAQNPNVVYSQNPNGMYGQPHHQHVVYQQQQRY